MMNDLSKNKIKVLVIEDSAFMRKVISDMLKVNPLIEVIDTAKNGREGIEKTIKYKPDVVTLDIEMPVMSGLEALPEIIKISPKTKVIMLSSLTKQGAEYTIKALEIGASDFISKPSNLIVDININEIKDELISKIIELSKSNYSRVLTHKFEEKLANRNIHKNTIRSTDLKFIIAIGTSTGGPRALQEVIPYIPEDIPAAILIVQHMPPGFTKSLASRLDSISKINVKEAEDGDVLKDGYAYIAPGDFHMTLKRSNTESYMISVNKDLPVSGHRPSVNVMMDSVAKCGHKNIIAVMMTGMGNDGTEGMKMIKQMGGKTIAQNEETCVVYGMPKSVVNIGIVDKIVSLGQISTEIIKFMGV